MKAHDAKAIEIILICNIFLLVRAATAAQYIREADLANTAQHTNVYRLAKECNRISSMRMDKFVSR